MADTYEHGVNDATLIVQQELKRQHSLIREAEECGDSQDELAARIRAALLLSLQNRIQMLRYGQPPLGNTPDAEV